MTCQTCVACQTIDGLFTAQMCDKVAAFWQYLATLEAATASRTESSPAGRTRHYAGPECTGRDHGGALAVVAGLAAGASGVVQGTGHAAAAQGGGQVQRNPHEAEDRNLDHLNHSALTALTLTLPSQYDAGGFDTVTSSEG